MTYIGGRSTGMSAMTKSNKITLKALLAASALFLAGPGPAQSQAFYGFPSSEFSTAQATIMAAGSRANQVRKIRSVPSVGVVNLQGRRVPMLRDSSLPDPGELRISAARNAAGIRKLRAALRANPVTRKALVSRGVPIDRIVGIRIGSTGSLRVYLL